MCLVKPYCRGQTVTCKPLERGLRIFRNLLPRRPVVDSYALKKPTSNYRDRLPVARGSATDFTSLPVPSPWAEYGIVLVVFRIASLCYEIQTMSGMMRCGQLVIVPLHERYYLLLTALVDLDLY